MMEKKRKWEKPQLIVLERGRPEESVLGICKQSSTPFGPFFSGCLLSSGGLPCDNPALS